MTVDQSVHLITEDDSHKNKYSGINQTDNVRKYEQSILFRQDFWKITADTNSFKIDEQLIALPIHKDYIATSQQTLNSWKEHHS